MAQNLETIGQLKTGNKVYAVRFDGPPKYSPLATGKEWDELALSLWLCIAEGDSSAEVRFLSRQDYESDLYRYGHLKNDRYLELEEGSDKPSEFPGFWEEPQTFVRFVMGNENPERAVAIYCEAIDPEKMEKLASIIKRLTYYSRVEYLGSPRSSSLATPWKKWLGVE